MSEPEIVKAVEQSRSARADEWAIRQGMDIAKRHMPDRPFAEYSALACDIAEALQNAFDSLGGTVIPDTASRTRVGLAKAE